MRRFLFNGRIPAICNRQNLQHPKRASRANRRFQSGGNIPPHWDIQAQQPPRTMESGRLLLQLGKTQKQQRFNHGEKLMDEYSQEITLNPWRLD